MPRQRIFSKAEKRIVLAYFRAGLGQRAICRLLDIPFYTLNAWYKRYEKGDRKWAYTDDKAYTERQKAFELFKQGYGYKSVATQLKVPQSRTKNWQLLFKGGDEDFFKLGRKRPRRYTEEQITPILKRYSVTPLSKKQFCSKEGIAICTLNRWLKEING